MNRIDKMDRMDRIYNLFVNEGYEDLPEKLEAENKLDEYLQKHGLSEFDYEDYVNSLSSENMIQGFKYGFRFAVELLVGGKEIKI